MIIFINSLFKEIAKVYLNTKLDPSTILVSINIRNSAINITQDLENNSKLFNLVG
jgi:hypothetical protein